MPTRQGFSAQETGQRPSRHRWEVWERALASAGAGLLAWVRPEARGRDSKYEQGATGAPPRKRVINWPTVLGLGLLAGLVSGCSAAATWFLLTGGFSLFATVAPAFLCVGMYLGTGIRKALLVPSHQLPPLD